MPILDETSLARLDRAHASDPDAAAYADAPAMLVRFQQRFPAERLRALSGTQLLEELHGRSSLDCLSYWLEFRDKPDFRARLFGSIRGGSALSIEARAHVGVVQLGPLRVTILPKIATEDLWFILAYGLGLDVVDRRFPAELLLPDAPFTDVLALLLLEEANALLRRGLRRGSRSSRSGPGPTAPAPRS